MILENKKIKHNWYGRDIEIEIYDYLFEVDRSPGERVATLKIDGHVFIGSSIFKKNENESEIQLIEKAIFEMEGQIKRYASGEMENQWQLRRKNGSKWAETVIPHIQQTQPIAQWLVKTFKL